MENCWASRCARPRPGYGPSITGRRRSRRPRGGILLVSLVLAFAFRACIVSAQLIGPDYVSPTGEETCWVPCKDTPESNVAVPLTNCKLFYVCRGGKVTNRLACSEGRSFDVNIGACNHENLVNCVDPTCPPTDFPTTSPTYSPSGNPTASPTESPTDSPTVSPTESPTPRPQYAMLLIQERQSLIEQMVFKSYTAEGIAYPSIRYDFDGLVRGLQVMGVQGFGGDFQFMLWDSDPEMYQVGLVNLAAFLANAMVEGIADDTCDELNWQQVAGRYALSNACGQEGRSYQDETCGIYSCIVDPSMEITAVHAANDVRAPPPFECRPGTGPNFHAGYWDTNTGTEVKNTPYANTAGRIDIEGCCYWGRGVLLSRGACSIGKLDYFLGARAAREGRRSLYPDIDFCNDPEATCSSAVTDELRWTASLFEWAERVQRYNSDGWNYEDELFTFYNSGMADDNFINAVSRVFYLGCHEAGCSGIDVREMNQRKQNFYVIINEVFGIDGIKSTTKQPTRRPTPRPLAPFVTPKPTQEPATPGPIDPQTQLNPPGPEPPLLPPPTDPPLPTAPYPTVPIYPTPPVPTPRPIAVATPRPTTSVPILTPPTSDSETTEEPTYFDTLVSLEDNGACRSSVFLWSVCSALFAWRMI